MKKSIVFVFMVLIFVLAAFSSAGAQSKKYITLGRYEQDNNVSNGPEEIEWLVLAENLGWGDSNDKYALIVSRYVLDGKPYNETKEDVTWETSSIRKWLNNDFCNSAFTQSEKDQIGLFKVGTRDNPDYHTSGGNITSGDRIILLSYDEIINYMPVSSRRCEATAYARTKGISLMDNETGIVGWATRTPGSKSWGVVTVDPDHDGTFYMPGGVVQATYGIRPALYIKWNN